MSDTTDTLAEGKHALRRKMIARRRGLSRQERSEADAVIRMRAMRLSALQGSRIVMLYASTAEEIDLFPLMEALLANGHRIALPEITGKGVMEARVFSLMDGLIEGAFGILTPAPECSAQIQPGEIDMVIVPGTAFSPDGRRLGLGGGYYDRFLPRAVDAVRLVLAFDFQIVPDIPMGMQDARVDIILTECRRIFCKKKDLKEEV